MSVSENHLSTKPTWVALRSHHMRFSLKVDRRVPYVAALLIMFILVVIVLSVTYGEYEISPGDVIQTIFGTLDPAHPDYRNLMLVVHSFRLPRILVAFMVGAALAVSGAIVQGITRNPLADPGLLGVSAGASVAAVAIIVVFKNVPIAVLPIVAFAGAIITAAVIFLLAWKRGSAAPTRLILIGIAIEAVLGSIISFMMIFGDINDVQQAQVWMTGSVYGRNWEHVKTIAICLLVLLPIVMLCARNLNTLHLGDEVAKGVGMRVERGRVFLLVLCVALAAVSVAVAGAIAFVGLVAPHVTRRLVGPSHEGMLVITALFGGALLVVADLIGRWVIAPSELPIGIVTAIIGAPYFLYLLFRTRNMGN